MGAGLRCSQKSGYQCTRSHQPLPTLSTCRSRDSLSQHLITHSGPASRPAPQFIRSLNLSQQKTCLVLYIGRFVRPVLSDMKILARFVLTHSTSRYYLH